MRWLRKDYQLRNVSNGTVVSLVEAETAGTPNSLTICLDNEPDFTEMDNRSMNVEHLTPKSTDYFKLRGCGLNQIRSFRGKKYKIFQIMTRTQYGLNYVYSKMQEKPDMFKGVAWMINTEDVEALVQQMKELDDERKIHLKSLIDSYNFVDNPMGLPIDSLTMGDINRYIEAFWYFLYATDEAFLQGNQYMKMKAIRHMYSPFQLWYFLLSLTVLMYLMLLEITLSFLKVILHS
nr:hypothetical protein [uncultured Butyrivibrio sp.]